MSIKIVMALLASLIPSVASSGVLDTAEPRRYQIENDGGGSVEEFEEALSYMSKEKMKVSVGGMCASACTLVLSTRYELDVCIKEDVIIGIHKPYASTQYGTVVRTIPFIVGAEKIWKETFFKNYPTWLQTAILARGEVPSVMQGDPAHSLMRFVYDDLEPFMEKCDD